MLIFLLASALFAVVLFWQSTGIPIRSARRGLFGVYLALGLLTLAFQAYVRFHQCEGPHACALSLAKALVWAVIWPASWLVYLAGL